MTAKKILSAVLSAFILVIIISAGYKGEAAEGEYTYRCGYMYDMLEVPEEKQLYDDLEVECEKIHNSYDYYARTDRVYYSKRLSRERAVEVMIIFVNDNPQYFWLSTTYTAYSGNMRADSISIELLDYFSDGDIRQATKAKIESIQEKYIKGAEEYQTDYERALYLHNMLLKNVEYKIGDWDQTVASVFLQGETVCAGYSKAYALLCNALGIDTIVVVSKDHAWNMINLYGYWFNVDVTNDYNSSIYLFVSDKRVAEIDKLLGVSGRHTPETKSYPYYYDDFPECEYSYAEIASKIPGVSQLRGDANSDGLVNVRDAAFIAKHISQGIVANLPQKADYNMDGIINVRDSASLARNLSMAA